MTAKQIVVTAGLGGHFSATEGDTNSQDPYWILITLPYLINDTFDRSRMADQSAINQGFRIVNRPEDVANSRKTDVLLFDNEVQSWQVNYSKSSSLHSLNMQLFNGDNSLALLEWLNGGDWCLFWAFNNRKDYDDVRRSLIKNFNARPWHPDRTAPPITGPTVTVNDWELGMKFVGRLQSIKAFESRDTSGGFQTGYGVQALGFTELNATIFFNSLFGGDTRKIEAQFYQDLGVNVEHLRRDDGFINSNMLVPSLIQIFLGQGPGDLAKDRGGAAAKVEEGRKSHAVTPNLQFEIPDAIGKIFGTASPTVPVPAYYSDLLAMTIGDQSYSSGAVNGTVSDLIPDVTQPNPKKSIFFTTNPIVDYFIKLPEDFKNVSAWEVAKHYLNEPINEMYVALKPHPVSFGLVPTFIMRRSPYTSSTYQGGQNILKALPFSEYPQWVIPNSLITGYSIGKTDAARMNYVYLTPSTLRTNNPVQAYQAMALLAPPVTNSVDVARHGLRMTQSSVAGFAFPTADRVGESTVAQRYTEFFADMVMDAHLRYNGTISSVGLQEPLQAGDNLVFNNILFHIESLTHSGGIDYNGHKTFNTEIEVSHGMPITVVDTNDVAGGHSADELLRSSLNQPTDTLGTVDIVEASQAKHDQVASQPENEREAITDGSASVIKLPEDRIRSLRNARLDLVNVKLIGAKTRLEKP